MELKDLLGKHLLSGVQYGKAQKRDYDYDEPSTVDFILDGKVLSVIEDRDDGYRSSMREIVIDREGLVIANTFKPVEVIGTFRQNSDYEENDVIDFIDSITGKIVLSVGTENINDYYPCFVGHFAPENLCLNQTAQDVRP